MRCCPCLPYIVFTIGFDVRPLPIGHQVCSQIISTHFLLQATGYSDTLGCRR